MFNGVCTEESLHLKRRTRSTRLYTFFMRVQLVCWFAFPLAPAAWASAGSSLPDAPRPSALQDRSDLTLKNAPLSVLKDQGAIWTSPLHIRKPQLVWLLPLAGATAASIATDSRASNDVVSHDPGFNNANTNVSNALIGGLIALPAGLYGWGAYGHHEHAREAGLLGGEALVDAVIVEQGTKLIFFRERPAQDNGRGLFFQSSAGGNSSLPSSHAVLAWASAAVLAEEYPSTWARVGVYTFATGVSLTRVLGQQHFPTDVLLGSAAGWLIGHYVAKRHPWQEKQMPRHLAAP